ncbi:MAG TPA: Mth938-like domain-containing protein [Hyphomicrobiaceae bacterium]|nr:Mth938-like domain-containing protein [Hyphomicrobiaceae bacterium]
MAVAWGRIEVEGAGTFRDAKLFPGGAREWDWRETGTEHTPGIQPADVRELLDHGATTVVLSQGMLKRLGTCPETIELLKQRRVGVHVLPTQDAVGLYNDLRKTEPVAGLFHTTCYISGALPSWSEVTRPHDWHASHRPGAGGQP